MSVETVSPKILALCPDGSGNIFNYDNNNNNKKIQKRNLSKHKIKRIQEIEKKRKENSFYISPLFYPLGLVKAGVLQKVRYDFIKKLFNQPFLPPLKDRVSFLFPKQKARYRIYAVYNTLTEKEVKKLRSCGHLVFYNYKVEKIQ